MPASPITGSWLFFCEGYEEMSSRQEVILEGVRILCSESSDMMRKANRILGDAGVDNADRIRVTLYLAIGEIEEALMQVVNKQIGLIPR